jgi:hypothetical protein
MDSPVPKVTVLEESLDHTTHTVDTIFNALLNPMLGAGKEAQRFTQSHHKKLL